jgi:hypothetical protein
LEENLNFHPIVKIFNLLQEMVHFRLIKELHWTKEQLKRLDKKSLFLIPQFLISQLNEAFRQQETGKNSATKGSDGLNKWGGLLPMRQANNIEISLKNL